MIVELAALFWGICLLLVSIVPYRAKTIINSRDVWTVIRMILVIYESLEAPLSYSHLFSLFAFYYSLIYTISRSSSPYGSIILLLSAIVFGLSARYESLLPLGFALFFLGFVVSKSGDYNVKREEFIVGDVRRLREISEEDDAVVGVIPNKPKCLSYSITSLFIRLYNVAYEPPNGVLVSLASLSYSIIFAVMPRRVFLTRTLAHLYAVKSYIMSFKRTTRFLRFVFGTIGRVDVETFITVHRTL